MMRTLALLTVLWLSANLLHWAWVAVRRRLWERTFTRGPDGLLPDAAAYTEGHGRVALLFVHGFADTPMLWKKLIGRLAQGGGFTCRAMRLPGAGEPLAAARRKTLACWQEAIAAEIAALRATHAAVWVIGHSMGGALAIDAAHRAPQHISGLVLLAPLIEVSRARSPFLAPRIGFQIARVVFALSPTFESFVTRVGTAPDDPAFRFLRDRFIPFSVYRNLFTLTASNARLRQPLTLPVFAAVAGRDRVVDSDAAVRWLADHAKGAKLQIFPDAGHVLPLKHDWQSLADSIADFVLNPRHD